MCLKTVILNNKKLSEFCQKLTNWQVSDTYLSISWNIFRKHLPYKCVRKLSDLDFWHIYDTFKGNILNMKCAIKLSYLDFWHNSDTFIVFAWNIPRWSACQNCIRNLSHWQFSDTFPVLSLHKIIKNVSENCHISTSDTFLIHL